MELDKATRIREKRIKERNRGDVNAKQIFFNELVSIVEEGGIVCDEDK